VFEVLHRFFVRFCGLPGPERSHVAPLPCLGVFLAGVQSKLSALQFPNHLILPLISLDFVSGFGSLSSLHYDGLLCPVCGQTFSPVVTRMPEKRPSAPFASKPDL